ncbi:15161_t:CDS:2, partial [Acaulospora morrowiae]
KRSLVRTQSISRSNIVPNKPLKRGTSTLRKRAPPRNMEFASTSNPVHSNDPTDMESDILPRRTIGLPWLPGSPKPPKLIHASLVPLPNRAQRAASTNPNRTSRIIPTNPDRTSKRLSSINPNRTSRILSTMNPRRNLKNLASGLPNNNSLARANSLRRRASVKKRASLDFRRQLLEESLMVSFGGIHNTQPQAHPKPPIRRKTRKGKKEQSEVTGQDQGEMVGTENVVKRLEMTRIISTRELAKKVEEEN